MNKRKKKKRIKQFLKWFNEHHDEVMEHDDGIILAVVHEIRATSIATGDGDLIASMLGHLIERCHQSWQKEYEQ